mmetsp:Transcript_14192/g.41738  ORF Transcript_14192/g.41738 Transcript_14192/m.41738 type:complete len:226 (+) Transcript_14192:211-888(+)
MCQRTAYLQARAELCARWHARSGSAAVSEDGAAPLLLPLRLLAAPAHLGHEHRPDGAVEHILEPLLCQRRALEVVYGADLPSELLAQSRVDGVARLGGVSAQIKLGADEHHGRPGAVLAQLRHPFVAHVLQGGLAHEAEGDDEHVGVLVGQGAQPVVVLLAGSIPDAEHNRPPVNEDVGRVIVKDGGDVVLGKGVCGVRYEHARFPHGTIADDDALHVRDAIVLI